MLNLTMIIALASFAAGAAGSFMITDWWNGISYSSAVSDAVKEQKVKQTKSEAILKDQLAEARKTHIKYRTIRSRANEINVYSPCLSSNQFQLWREASRAATNAKADKPNGTLRTAAGIIKARRSFGTEKPH